ncbi:MAG: 4a-hydroxytetrahydrobiopterin dehydratase [Anaerolineales bacterium]
MAKLTPKELDTRLSKLPGWEVLAGMLTKTYTVSSFARGVLFIAAIGQLAEAANHHPDVSLHGYSHVTVGLVTHSEGGITDKDCDLAAQVDAVPQPKPKNPA